MSIQLCHYDDGKEKYQSHEIYLKDDISYYNKDLELFSHNLFDIVGMGSNKEEALKDFENKFRYLMDELEAFGKMLLETDVITNDIKEVDCCGNIIE